MKPAPKIPYGGKATAIFGLVLIAIFWIGTAQRSATELSDAQRRDLTSNIAAMLKKQPVLDVRVDPERLGGMIVQVGDRVIDTTVRTRLETIRTLLLDKATSYVLQQV